MTSSPHFNLKSDNEIPIGLDAWLNHDKSITDKLIQLTGEAELEVLSQQWISAKWWDIHVFLIKEPIFQREIFMKSKERVYWYARTVIPQSCYRLESDFFKRLEHESIRNLIFNEPKVSLVQKVVYPINPQCIEFHWISNYLNNLHDILWVRLAEYSFTGSSSFYLIEILFPDVRWLR
jgi:chorismate lyase